METEAQIPSLRLIITHCGGIHVHSAHKYDLSDMNAPLVYSESVFKVFG